MNEKAVQLQDDELDKVSGGVLPGKSKGKVRVVGLKAEGGAGKGFMFACQNAGCGKAFIITNLDADEYECPYCHKVHISCG